MAKNLTLIKKLALLIGKSEFYIHSFLVFIVTIIAWQLQAQNIVNGYAEVTNISGTTLSLGSINETYHTFNVGEKIIIMQMQDACLTTSTTNNASFGSLNVIQSAGLYEVTTITARFGSTIIVSTLTNTYNIGPNSSVQIVTFRRLGNPNYSTNANITGLAWNGQIGGIIAIEVPGILTLNHNISANGIGFRGGSRSINWTTPQGCRDNPYISNNPDYGAKGEGIFKNTNTNWLYARGRMINGGGGGNDHNGGGGSNISYGGEGGAGWNGGGLCPAGQSAGGLGGTALASYISYTRIFMGGGGGGAQQNNNVGTSGGNGGGIVFLSAGAITTNANVAITSNGNSTANGGNDGTGGGGAGGTLILQCNNYLIPNPYTLTITANGGNTGNVGSPNIHGAGGAGGKGAIFFTTSGPPINTNIQANNGIPGCNNNGNGSPCNTYGGYAGPGNGIFFLGHGTPLPIPFLDFSAHLLNNQTARIQWHLTNIPPTQLLEFTLLKSFDAQNWTQLTQIPFSPQQNHYSFEDFQLQNGLQFYKLMAVDIDGNFYFSDIQTINLEDKPHIFPVPFQDELHIAMQSPPLSIQFFNLNGQLVYEFSPPPNATLPLSLNTQQLPKGTYFIRINTEKQVFTQTIIK